MKDSFALNDDKKIADSVANVYAKNFPDYYKEEIILKAIIDKSFVMGDMFPFFLHKINIDVLVQPFDSMPEIPHGQYLYLRHLPETVKNLLFVYRWKIGDVGDGTLPPQIYCCETHGFLNLDNLSPQFLSECEFEHSIGQATRTYFDRSLISLFEEDC